MRDIRKPFVLPKGTNTCPYEDCPAHKTVFKPHWRVNEHLKQRHGWPRRRLQRAMDARLKGNSKEKSNSRRIKLHISSPTTESPNDAMEATSSRSGSPISSRKSSSDANPTKPLARPPHNGPKLEPYTIVFPSNPSDDTAEDSASTKERKIHLIDSKPKSKPRPKPKPKSTAKRTTEATPLATAPGLLEPARTNNPVDPRPERLDEGMKQFINRHVIDLEIESAQPAKTKEEKRENEDFVTTLRGLLNNSNMLHVNTVLSSKDAKYLSDVLKKLEERANKVWIPTNNSMHFATNAGGTSAVEASSA